MRPVKSLLVFIAFSLILSLFAIAKPTQAATLTVTNLNESGVGSLRAMISAAASGDTINFASGLTGTITLTSGELLIDKTLTIQGTGMNALTFTSTTSRIFHVGTTGNLTLTDVAFKNIQLQTPSIRDFGLGVYSEGTTALWRVLGSGNQWSQSSSAVSRYVIFSETGTLNIFDSLFQSNQTVSVGIGTSATSADIERSEFLNNSDVAIVGSGGTVAVKKSNFRNNSSGNSSGGVAIFNGNAAISDSQFIGNQHTGCSSISMGGGAVTIYPLMNIPNATVTGSITRSLFQNNSATGFMCGAGAVLVNNTTISHSTFIGNQYIDQNNQIATCPALGLHNFYDATQSILEYSTFTGNLGPATICNGNKPLLRANLAYGNYPQNPINVLTDFVSGGYNILGDRNFAAGFVASDFPANTNPQFGNIGDNGGNTTTVALLPNSPARNAIPVGMAGCTSGITDQRGVARPQGGACDVGAFETYGTGEPDHLGSYKDGVFYLYNGMLTDFNTPPAISIVYGGGAGQLPVAGDWNNDGIDTIGIYDTNTGLWHLRNSNTGGAPDAVVLFGNPSDLPLTGRWASDTPGDSIGVYRQSTGVVFLRKSIADGTVQYVSIFGNPGDQMVAGDYDGDGVDTLGVYRPGNGNWYLSNANTNGFPTAPLAFEWIISSSSYPFTWDYDGDAISTVAYRSGISALGGFLHTNAASDTTYVFYSSYVNVRPIAGKWFAASAPNPLQSLLVYPGQTINRNNANDGNNTD